MQEILDKWNLLHKENPINPFTYQIGIIYINATKELYNYDLSDEALNEMHQYALKEPRDAFIRWNLLSERSPWTMKGETTIEAIAKLFDQSRSS